MVDWIGDGIDFEYLPPEIAKIINDKEGRKSYDDSEYAQIKKHNDYSERILKKAESIPQAILKTYKPKTAIVQQPENQIDNIKCDKLWFPRSKRYNLDKLVYAWMFKEVYKNNSSIGIIIEETSKIYSWANYIQGYYKANHILWFQIRNIDETHSYLKFQFNKNNIKEIYREYLNAVAYCIDNGLSN